MDRVGIKKEAKEITKEKLSDAVALQALTYLISFCVGMILGFILGIFGIENESVSELLTSMVSVGVSCVLGFGTASYYLKSARKESVTYKELWSKVNLWKAYLVISLLVGLYVLCGTILFIIPGIILSYSYAMVYLVYLDNPTLSYKEVLRKSKEMMKGHKWEYFILGVSFIGWAILGVFTLGILYLWLIPYMEISLCIFYDRLVKSQNTPIQTKEVINSNNDSELFKIN